MAKCKWCHREMNTADSCGMVSIGFPDGKFEASVPCESDRPNHRCYDCGVKVGKFLVDA